MINNKIIEINSKIERWIWGLPAARREVYEWLPFICFITAPYICGYAKTHLKHNDPTNALLKSDTVFGCGVGSVISIWLIYAALNLAVDLIIIILVFK